MATRTLTVTTLSDTETADSVFGSDLGPDGTTRIGDPIDVDTDDGEGLSLREALHLAALYSYVDGDDVLIEFGTDPDDPTADLAGVIELADTLVIDTAVPPSGVSLAGASQSPPIVTINGDGRITISGDKGTSDDDDNIQLLNIVAASSVTLQNLTFTKGSAQSGGAISNAADLFIENSTFTENSADQRGGAISSTGSLTVRKSKFDANTSNLSGGAISAADGDVTIDSSFFDSNSAALGGAVATGTANRDDIEVVNSTFFANTASSSAAIFSQFANVSVLNSAFTGNRTEGSVNGNDFGIISGATLTLANSLVLGNRVENGPLLTTTVGDPLLLGGNIVGRVYSVNGTVVDQLVTPGNVWANVEGVDGLIRGVPDANGFIALSRFAFNPALDGGSDAAAPNSDALGRARVDVPGVGENGPNISDLGPVELSASTFEDRSLVVTTSRDIVDPFDNLTSLREAIAFANDSEAGLNFDGDADNDGNANDTITFDATTSDFQFFALIRLTEGQLVVTDDLTIDGASAGGTVVITGDANDDDRTVGNSEITNVSASLNGQNLLSDNSRIFDATGNAALSLTALTLTGGRTTTNGLTDGGGAIRSVYRAVTLTDSTVSGNSTKGRFAEGGGISSRDGAVTLTNSTVSDNSTSGFAANGGGIFSFNGAV